MKCPRCKREIKGKVREGTRCGWCGLVIRFEDLPAEVREKLREEKEKLSRGRREEEKLLAQIENGTLTFPAVTMQYLPGFEIVKLIGPAYGLTIRSRGVGGRVAAGIETFFGGEVTAYVSECVKARNESLARLIIHAKKMGANAVVKIDFETSEVLPGVILFSAYGTAVVAKPSARAA